MPNLIEHIQSLILQSDGLNKLLDDQMTFVAIYGSIKTLRFHTFSRCISLTKDDKKQKTRIRNAQTVK